jgi:hypothetical protein
MKLNSALAKSLLMAASMGMVTPVLAQTFPRPAKPAQPAPKPAPDEEPATIEGIEIARKNGGYLGVTVKGPRLVLKFYDSEKKPAPLDVARAAARWNPVNKTGDERSVLNPAGDGSLVSTPVVKPPLVFKVYLTLLDADGKEVESTVVDLRRLNEPKP